MSKRPKLRSAPHLRKIRGAIARYGDEAVAVAEDIADFAEPPLQEFKSADRLEEFLSGNGFSVTRPWKKMPTAFKAVVGKNRPRIAFLAEYDALPDCGPRPGQWGHGCGHNLLGAGSALAGIVAAEIAGQIGAGGQVIVIGTPAEEILSGKVMLAEEKAFNGLDAVIAWHPSGETCVKLYGGQAMDSLSLLFHGSTAHAAACPHEGRSALDAAILTDVAVNYLREHVEENVRIHSVLPNGGKAPNVVPDRAELWYYIRGRDRKQVDELTGRVIRCARGAAIATDTRYRVAYHDSITERIPNRTLAEVLDAVLHRCGPPKFTPADARAAEKLLPGKSKYNGKIEPLNTKLERASSDESNVSWFAPLGRLNVVCGTMGVTAHHRDNAVIARAPGAHRGMRKAAEVMAMGALELMLNPPVLAKVQQEFGKAMKGKKYKLPPRSNLRRPGS